MKRFLILIALLLASMSLHAGELVFHWNTMADSKIFDMEFMPDNDYFVIVTANEFQVRKTEDGEIFKTYPKTETYEDQDIEFSPDSTKLFLSYGEVIEMRDVEDFSIIQTYTMPPAEEGYSPSFLEIKVDPKKPYIYALERQWWVGTPGEGAGRDGIFVYNYETMEKVADITPAGFDRKVYGHIAISSDGKYLSFINQGESYLITIDLATQKELQRFRICKNYSDGGGSGGMPVCIKFSELDSDKIYFSGMYPRDMYENNYLYGLLIYSISENKIIDSTFGFGENQICNSRFTFFDNENKAMATSGVYVYTLDFKNFKFLYNNIINSEMGGIALQIIYNKNNFYFLGRSEKNISRFVFKDDVLVKEINNIDKTLYPNPTNGLVNIDLNCNGNNKYYEIYDSNSVLIKRAIIQNNFSMLQIDLSNYPNAAYYIRINCGNNVLTYKIIKEN